MPTTRKRRTRVLRPEIDPAMLAWLKDEGPAPIEHYFMTDDELRALWDTHKAGIMAAWTRRGKPSFWRKFDAPNRNRAPAK